ncbi:ASKHA domain-containing protein [Kiritimatiella glycovorans]
MRRNNARRIGLLPQISCERIKFIGNASSMGAKFNVAGCA